MQALELGLADELKTSDDYLFEKAVSREVFSVHYPIRRRLAERLSESFAKALHKAGSRLLSDVDQSRYGQ
jgi:serine protease SohB